MRLVALCTALALLAPPAAHARRPSRRRHTPKSDAAPGFEPAHYFATTKGLVRIYHGRIDARRGHHADEEPAGAGISCEVVESKHAEPLVVASTREFCTFIVDRKPKVSTQLTYELRPAGIFVVRQEADGQEKAATMDRLLLPAPLRSGSSWKETRGAALLVRTVKSAGQSCKAAGREFGDCLVLSVTQQAGHQVKRFHEVYAAGVGLVEDAQWQLIDVKGL